VKVVLIDKHAQWKNLLPLSYTRSIAGFRVGILTIKEKYEKNFGGLVNVLTEAFLQPKYGDFKIEGETLFVVSNVLPNEDFLNSLNKLKTNTRLINHGELIAFKTDKAQLNYQNFEVIVSQFEQQEIDFSLSLIKQNKDVFALAGQEIERDFLLLTKGRKSAPLSNTNTLIGTSEKLFIEEGAYIEASVLNTNTGYIYIGKNAEIMESCTIRGPFALCENAGLKMAAKIYGPTVVGPYCKVGGEVNNSVFFAYSNKGHDGFIGNSVIGEWCNLGADTNNSNLKNNYANVDVWNYSTEKYEDTGMQFHGLIMGDHSKAGINTMFNTGTVVGVSANIFGGDFPPRFIPSFTWGGAQWLRTFLFEKSLEVAEKMMERRNIKLTTIDIEILKEVFEREKKYRKQ
jgi:UDP-N-acetylglucosamine diphosphorylase/glucosamine-1-phosphate N-acetyltransferase